MPAEFESGVFTSGQPAWHGLGTVIEDDKVNAERALVLAELDWSVAKEPVTRNGIEIPDQFFTVRDKDDSVLGVVGSRYLPIQNVEAFDFMDTLLGERNGFHYVTAGSLRGGKVVWMLAKPDFKIDLPDSPIDPYVLLANYHDGTGAVKASVTPVRVVCMNTLRAALSGAKASVSIRHTTNAKDKMGEAQKVLGLARGAADKMEANALALYKSKIFDRELDAFLKTLVPEAPANAPERTKNNVVTTRNAIRSIYDGEAGGQREIRGTAWGALNAVAAFNDHVKNRRNTKGASAEENRFADILLGDNITNRAAEILLPR